jgi:hypothetical protein
MATKEGLRRKLHQRKNDWLAVMNEAAAEVASIPFVLRLCRLIKTVGRLFHSRQQPWLVLCPTLNHLSIIEAEVMLISGGNKPGLAVRDCLLWPELHGCEQQCVNKPS